jgi:LmbE family N-acetylglucosaminyl deacetylase
MRQLRRDPIRSVLCLGAHADDIEIGCGGALLQLIAENPELDVTWVVFSATPTRIEEAQASANAFLQGVANPRVIVEGFRDSYFPFQGAQIKECVERIRATVNPDLIFTHRRDDMHQDHRLVCELTGCAWRDHLILEYEIPKFDGDLTTPNVYVPLTAELAERKVELLARHFPSQQSKPWFTADTFLGLMRIRGIECNAAGRYAEGFHVRKLLF